MRRQFDAPEFFVRNASRWERFVVYLSEGGASAWSYHVRFSQSEEKKGIFGMGTELVHAIEETRSQVAADRTEAIFALEDAQQALDLATSNFAVAKGLLRTARILEKATKAKQAKAKLLVGANQLTMAADAVVACRQAVNDVDTVAVDLGPIDDDIAPG